MAFPHPDSNGCATYWLPQPDANLARLVLALLLAAGLAACQTQAPERNRPRRRYTAQQRPPTRKAAVRLPHLSS